MNIVVQRVSGASVIIQQKESGSINRGLVLLTGIEKGDTRGTCERAVHKIMSFRVFADDAGQMNEDLKAIDGDLLLVPNFTLCADTQTGNRPGFSPAADPEVARPLFDHLSRQFREQVNGTFARGTFGSEMRVNLVNDGPVTFYLEL